MSLPAPPRAAEQAATRSLRFAQVLRCGALAGGIAGLAAAVVSLLLVEPPLEQALALEAARESAAGAQHDDLISRPVQVLGGMVTAGVVGLAVGAIFAVAFARVRHLLPGRADFSRALALALTGFGVLALLPAVKYPANPPGVGDPATVGSRTLLYALLLAAGVLIVAGSRWLYGWLHARGRTWPVAATMATGTAVAAGVVLLLMLPGTPDVVPADMPADLLWRFRLASLAQLATLWGVLGFAAGLLLERAAARR